MMQVLSNVASDSLVLSHRFEMKKLLFIVLLILPLLFIYYANKPQNVNSPCHIVLKYEDFGSDVRSSKLLGQAWWQWYPAYGVLGSKFDIKVVVYTQAEDLEKIKAIIKE